jgi:hypothetical protein
MNCMAPWMLVAGVLLLLDVKMSIIFKKDMRIMTEFNKLNQHGFPLRRGVLISEPVKDPISGEEKVYVKWDRDRYNHPNPEEKLTKELMREVDGEVKLADLQAEWNEAEAKIKEKLTEAAALIKEASVIGTGVGCDSLLDMYDAIDPLYSAMDSAGWNTSSFGC